MGDTTPQVQDDKTKITFKCTICNTNFKKKASLMRHNRDFHDAFYQSERGIKRKTANKGSVKKRVKTTTRGVKRKPVMIKLTDKNCRASRTHCTNLSTMSGSWG